MQEPQLTGPDTLSVEAYRAPWPVGFLSGCSGANLWGQPLPGRGAELAAAACEVGQWVSGSDAKALEGTRWERALCLLPELRSKRHAVLCAPAGEVCSSWLALSMVPWCCIFWSLHCSDSAVTLSVMFSLICQNHSPQRPTSESRSCSTLLTGTFPKCHIQLKANPASSDPSQSLSTEHLTALVTGRQQTLGIPHQDSARLGSTSDHNRSKSPVKLLNFCASVSLPIN